MPVLSMLNMQEGLSKKLYSKSTFSKRSKWLLTSNLFIPSNRASETPSNLRTLKSGCLERKSCNDPYPAFFFSELNF